jgi:hypothetical protein
MRAARMLLAMLILLPLTPGLVAAEDPEPAPPEGVAFPSGWEGVWRGACRYGPPGSPAKPMTMELRVRPIEGRDAWTWTIVYGGPGGSQTRPYELIPVDREKGHWRIDEKNGIVLDNWLVEETLHCRFSVQSNVIEVRNEMRDGGIDVMLTTYDAKPASVTGGEGRIPAVGSYRLLSVQRGRLVRID